MKVFLTGATGFVGYALLNRFITDGNKLSVLVRNESVGLPVCVRKIVGDLAELEEMPDRVRHDDFYCVLRDADVVVHAAARAHIMKDKSVDPLVEYRKVNRDATLALARIAAESGVSRFVFLSSIGVNGNQNTRPFTGTDLVNPHNAYSLSKYEAEQGLLEIANETGMELVIIRPPLVYDANAPGNFGSLVKWVKKGVPLPLGAVHNQRSLVALDNLVDFIELCADKEKSPKAANQVFLISDGEDVSTSELLRKVANAYGVKSRLLPVPVSLMKLVAK
ncbi:MAG: NAD-dependent epimerase/dehydratase family protein, partial [Pseudomonadota bacterium]|nr:NAD-dependent epimerase/dehydratase family protein [Pseudomonadota bacterium]